MVTPIERGGIFWKRKIGVRCFTIVSKFPKGIVTAVITAGMYRCAPSAKDSMVCNLFLTTYARKR